MQTKDFVYLGVIALTAAVFYWHGYLAAHHRARKAFASIFHLSRAFTEMPPAEQAEEADEADEVKTRLSSRFSRQPEAPKCVKIRAIFGVN